MSLRKAGCWMVRVRGQQGLLDVGSDAVTHRDHTTSESGIITEKHDTGNGNCGKISEKKKENKKK